MADPQSTVVDILGLKVAEKGLDVVHSFLERLFGPVTDEVGQAMADPVREWRKRRQERAARVISEAAQILDDAGELARPVPGRILMPLLEKSSLEEDKTLHAQWVALLANTARNPSSILPAFVSILGELSPLEASMLYHVWEVWKWIEVLEMQRQEPQHQAADEDAGEADTSDVHELNHLYELISDRGIIKHLGVMSEEGYLVLVENFERMRLVKHIRVGEGADENDEEGDEENDNWGLALTAFGETFAMVCSPKQPGPAIPEHLRRGPPPW